MYITFAFNFDPNQEKSFSSTQIELCFGRKKGKCVNTKRGSRYLGAYIYVYILLSCLLWYCTANTSTVNIFCTLYEIFYNKTLNKQSENVICDNMVLCMSTGCPICIWMILRGCWEVTGWIEMIFFWFQ